MLRFYGTLWSVYILAFFLTFLTGNLSMFAGVVFGFIGAGLCFAGMMCMVPIFAYESHHKALVEPETAEIKHPAPQEAQAHAFRVLKSA